MTTFNLAVGNTDAHAKNISILRPRRGRAVLAPAYDVAMHGHHGDAALARFAMRVNGKDDMATLTANDLVDEAMSWTMPRKRAVRAVVSTLEGLEIALREIPRDDHGGVRPAAWAVVEENTARLARQARALA